MEEGVLRMKIQVNINPQPANSTVIRRDTHILLFSLQAGNFIDRTLPDHRSPLDTLALLNDISGAML